LEGTSVDQLARNGTSSPTAPGVTLLLSLVFVSIHLKKNPANLLRLSWAQFIKAAWSLTTLSAPYNQEKRS